MRIANVTASRNYLKGLQRNYAMLNKYNQQVMSGMRFSNAAEDPSSAARALQVRRNLARIDGYTANAKSAASYFDAADKTLMQMSELNNSITELFSKGMDGGYVAENKESIATQIEKIRDELLSLANGKFSDRYMFGGTNVTTAPFTVDETTGDLYYNGVLVSGISGTDPIFDDASYIDIGLGINFNGTSDPTKVNPNSAFKNSIVGLDFVGFGSENLYLLATEMMDMLNSGSFDADEAGALLTRYQNAAAKTTLELTKIGSDTNHLEFTIDRLDSQRLNLIDRQSILEAKDTEEAIMDMKMQEYVYNAALIMGQRLLQPTLFNFMS